MAKHNDLGLIIRRLVKELESEKEIVARKDYAALEIVYEQKVRCLSEMERILRRAATEDFASAKVELAELKNALSDSETLLRAHLNAASGLCAMLREIIAEEASDGTYSAQELHRKGV